MKNGNQNAVNENGGNAADRRQFMKKAGAALASFTIIRPALVRGTQANSKIKLGMIGCGGRGTWIGNLFMEHGGYEIVAGADYFQDRVDTFGEKFGIGASKRFTGLSCYKKLLDSGVEAIAIESPPYFHPEHAAAGVEAGVHVYLAKPIAVDVPGCHLVGESGKKAAAKNLCFLADFQTRAHEFYREAVKRVQYGEIGKIISGEASYHCGPTWDRMFKYYEGGIKQEDRLRAWGLDRILSGDVITEQNIHALDVASWIMDAPPVKASGTGGRYRKAGDCWDFFSVIFTYPDDVLVTFNSKQYGKGHDDILCRMYGETGTIDTHYFGSVSIRGDRPYKGGDMPNLFTDGVKVNIADFHTNVTTGIHANTTVAPSVQSNLTTILGRTAAYKHGEVTWEEMLRANEKLDPKLEGLKA